MIFLKKLITFVLNILIAFFLFLFTVFNTFKTCIESIPTKLLLGLHYIVISGTLLYSAFLKQKANFLIEKNKCLEDQLNNLFIKVSAVESKIELTTTNINTLNETQVLDLGVFFTTVAFSILGCYFVYSLYPLAGIASGYILTRETTDTLQNSFLEAKNVNALKLAQNNTLIEKALTKTDNEIMTKVLISDQKITEFLLNPDIVDAVAKGFEFVPLV
jgi:hypothetical protein